MSAPGSPTDLGYVRHGSTLLAVGAGGACLDIIFLDYHFFFLIILGDGRVVRRCWVNFQCRCVLLIWIIVGQGPIALAVGASGGVLTFFLSSITFLFFLPLSGRRPDID